MPLVVLLLAAVTGPVAAWSPQTRLAIAADAASIAPPDLRRQIERHAGEYRRGTLNGSHGDLADETAEAVGAIRQLRPFSEIVYRLGTISALTAAANDPLTATAAYAPDYRTYVDSVRPRFTVVFYGEGRALDDATDLGTLARGAAERNRAFAPLLAAEYRRIGGPPGIDRFDDRSTAFGVAAVAFSHAVSDAAALFRYLWIEAGGADPRRLAITPPRPASSAR